MNALSPSLLDSTSFSSSADQDADLLSNIARAREIHNEWYPLMEASAEETDHGPHGPHCRAEKEYWASVEPEWNDLKGRICGARPRTPQGRLAKARYFIDCCGGGESDVEQSLLVDILDADGHFSPANSVPSTMHTIGLRLGEIDREITEHCDRERETILENERRVLERAILSQTPITPGDAAALQLVALSYVASQADGCEPLGESFADRATWVGRALAAGLRTFASAAGVDLALMGADYYVSGPLSPQETETVPVSCVRNLDGSWPKSLFPPGQHPTDAKPADIEQDDAGVIALCDQFDTLEAAFSATFAVGGPSYIKNERQRDKANKHRIKRQEELAPVIAATPAHTAAGVMAKLRSFAKWDAEILKPEFQGSIAETILSSACRDVMQGDVA